MIRLHPSQYYKLIEPVKKVPFNHLFALSVLLEIMVGDVFVDNTESPKTFLIKHPYGMLLLVGSCENELFNRQLMQYVLNEKQERDSVEWLQVYPDDWNILLSERSGELLLNNIEINRDFYLNRGCLILDKRVNFKFNPLKFNFINDTSLKLVRTNGDLFNRIEGTVIPKYFWKNSNHFTSDGIGFSILQNGKPVSTCFSAYVIDNQLELGIETDQLFWGRGYAKQLASTMLKYCIDNLYEPVWACRRSNEASWYLAQLLGFQPSHQLPYYRLAFNP